MDYELALELKQAGFQQAGRGFHSEILDMAASSGINVFRANVYFPTLEELIEACGDDIEALIQQTGTWVATQFNAWAGSEPTLKGTGTSPTEAVARLWLALHPLVPPANRE